MAHAERSDCRIEAARRNRSPVGPILASVFSLLAMAVVVGGLIGFVVYEGVRLLLDLLY